MWTKKGSRQFHRLVIILCICWLTTYASLLHAQNITNGLVSYYTFCDCTAKDHSGNNRHSSITGAPQCIQGMRDHGLLLNQNAGINSCGQRGGEYIQLPQLGAIWSEGFTVCAWIRFDEIKNYERILDFSNNNGEAGGLPVWFGREGNSNNLTLESWIDANGNQARSTGRLVASGAITNGSIEYYCATISSDTMRIYVNGTLVASKKGNPVANVARMNNYIGKSAWCSNDPDFKGFVDEVRIYNRALSAQEIQNLYKITNIKDFTVNRTCSSTQTSFELSNAVDIDSVRWDFGDPSSGLLNSSRNLKEDHVFTGYGTYNVRLIVYKQCLNDTVIKSVRIEPLNSTALGKDFEICPGKPKVLKVRSDGATYLWQNGSATDSFVVTQPGIYSLQYNLFNCSYKDTVTVGSAQKFSTQDVTICEGEIYEGHSTAGTFRDTFRASNGCDSIRTLNLVVRTKLISNTKVAICPGQTYKLPWGTVVSTSGLYSDTTRYTSGCDSLVRQVALEVISLSTRQTDASICANQQYTLPWGTVVTSAGAYRDTLRSAAGCDSLVRLVNLVVKPVPVITASKSNDINCVLGTTRLSASGGTRYIWSPATSLDDPSAKNPAAHPQSTTTYLVKGTAANGCIAEDSITVYVSGNNAGQGNLVPSAFSPNNDGKNDCFGVTFWGVTSNFSLSVFNRWGERVFYSTDYSNCWDGKINGKEAPVGIYIYMISSETNCGPVKRKGTFLLLR